NPVLELIDRYETYANPGNDAPIITTTDGIVSNEGYSSSTNYRRFNSPAEIFQGKDARFFASIIYPGSTWKNTTIVIQGGIVRLDGTLRNSKDSYVHNGVTYHTYVSNQTNQYSGFDSPANMTRSGFLMRKFLDENARINTFLQS